MKHSAAFEPYRQYYADMHFERAGLFDLIRRQFECQTVLYPGCSVHITPSFYFPHVVYVDSSEQAARFFAGMDDVLGEIARRKRYRRSTHVRFIEQDFTAPLPLPEASFDLLIVLYAGGVARACSRYLKHGGMLLTNNHSDDAGEAAADQGLALVAVIHERGERLRLSQDDLDQYFIRRDAPAPRTVQHIRATPQYTRTADYYVFCRR